MQNSLASSKPSGIKIIGIDPGFDRCGVAILEKTNRGEKLLYSECLVTSRHDSPEERLCVIGSALNKIIKKWQPNSMAIEKLFFNVNQKTALRVAEARGVILYEASRALLTVYEYSPQAVKVAVTGYGKATKTAVESMTLRLLGLKKAPKHDDETDAIAVGITHLASVRLN